MPTHAEGSTSKYCLTEEDMEGDLDTIVYDGDEDVDFVDLYKSANDAGDIREDSDDRVYGEDVEGEWDEGETVIKSENMDIEMI
ncbi:hypothetical protein HOY80DRAFT_1050859 [Tuber brumale]|nr:hypothetical protein HOY80DRAFT_1050859 [Tuber brumale]